MELNSPRPIRPSGWAFRLSDLRSRSRVLLLPWLPVVLSALLVVAVGVQRAGAQHDAGHPSGHDADAGPAHHGPSAVGAWEGSAAGVAYSEFNHHVAGWFLVIIALAELGQAIRPSHLSPWARLLLPVALGMTGLFLLIWSDHEAWPVGSMSFSQTFSGSDAEILQHKLYGILALAIAAIEIVRRLEVVRHAGWMVPLPAFAILGGWLLFSHSHGVHPDAHRIALHHSVMGTLAITAGSSKLVAAWQRRQVLPVCSYWELLWAGLVLLIGIQLIIYSE